MFYLLQKTKIIIIIFSFFILSSNNIFSQGFLHASGRTIVNGYGQQVHLKGMGLGGWLEQEGYMFQTSGFANSPTEIRNKIVGLIGEVNTDSFYQAFYQNFLNKKDVDIIAKWGFNSIRLPMHYNLLTPTNQPGVYTEQGFAMIDSLLAWCKENHLYLILDLHCAPGGQSSDNISDYQSGVPSLWESEENKTRTINLWKKLAERYANEEWIGGYDLLNEPHWDLSPNNQPLRDLYINITNAIRDVDTNHIVFIEGNQYATDFNGLGSPWDNNFVYSFHKYWNSNDQSSIQYLINLSTQYNVPLWLGESGENSNKWFTDCIELMQTNNIGWSWWPHKKIESIAGPLSAKATPEYKVLLNYWNNGGTKPTVTYAKNALMGMAANLAIEKCEYHPDVIDAMFRQINNEKTIPYRTNNVPGRIYAVNYDMGQLGKAYRDNDYEKNNGTSMNSWNSGSALRNDGVDIEVCTDSYSNGYDVGWIESGEFLNYTINVVETGMYNLNMRIAGNNSGGKILFRVDNQNVTGFIDVPVTGGWNSWKTISDTSNIELTAGSHLLQMNFYFGGFNVASFEFKKSLVSVEDKQEVIKSFKVYQNYPNPFNPSTKIKYSVPVGTQHAVSVQLNVYDILGNEVATLINKNQQPGDYEFNFDASNYHLSSGVYFFKVSLNGLNTKVMKAILLQ